MQAAGSCHEQHVGGSDCRDCYEQHVGRCGCGDRSEDAVSVACDEDCSCERRRCVGCGEDSRQHRWVVMCGYGDRCRPRGRQ